MAGRSADRAADLEATVLPGKGYLNCTPPTGTAWRPFTGDFKINAHFDYNETERLVNVQTGRISKSAQRTDRMQQLQYSLRIFSHSPTDRYDVPWQRPQRITHAGDPYMRVVGFRGSATDMLPDETTPKPAGYKAPPDDALGYKARPAGYKAPPAMVQHQPAAGLANFKRLRPSAVPRPVDAGSRNQLVDLTPGTGPLGLPRAATPSRHSWLPTVPEEIDLTWGGDNMYAGMGLSLFKSAPPRRGQPPPMPSRMPPGSFDGPEETDAGAKRPRRSSA